MKNNRIINKEVLELAKPGDIIASWSFTDEGFTNMGGTWNEIRWVAVRGCIPDWAVYCEDLYDEWLSWSHTKISKVWTKVPTRIVLELFDKVSEKALNKYRG